MRVGWKVTVGVTIHDVMLELRPNGVGGRHLRHTLRARFGKICRQGSINEPVLGVTIEFKFKRCYKLQRDSQQTTLGHLRIELLCTLHILSRALFDLCKALIEPLITRVTNFWTDKMTAFEEVMEIAEMTTKETTQALIVGNVREGTEIVAEIHKLPRMPRPKKEK